MGGINMEAVTINWLAVLAATLVGFAVGFVWYGWLFKKAWMNAVGITEEEVAKGNMAKISGLTFLFQFIMAYCLAMFFGNEVQAGTGAFYGFLTGFGWVATALGVNALYEQKSWKYIGINGGFWIVVFTLMGLIIGAW
ncbi:DUF1761 domain-containing protein [Gracilimonas mengyeensis]|uniref:DUF1761 domain-containing protein n=1 Tax=Gracilimonas mengyeensis TaxID=1302730 RepID=A0A521ERE0_9BACT|nr:DUF1761 domain-containing protein [Gracilimonas mengyeensis]SMO86496.1 Protein of unknown function [Gracilimonas mengyeensis]